MIYAIIPARGDSKGIPNKNLQNIGSKTLIGRAVETALAAEKIDQVYVSSDSRVIRNLAEHAGAIAIERPAEFATDEASTESVVLHALEILTEKPDLIVLIQCTSPFTKAQELDLAIERFVMSSADSCVAVCRSHCFHWEDGDPFAIPIEHDKKFRLRRQDMNQYRETGAFYVFKTRVFQESKTRFCGNTILFEVENGLDIDSPFDLEVARLYAKTFDK